MNEITREKCIQMLVLALFIDALQGALAFVAMGWMVTPFAWLIFFVWFSTVFGIGHFFKGRRVVKKFIQSGIAFGVEFMPLLAGITPGWTLWVFLMISNEIGGIKESLFFIAMSRYETKKMRAKKAAKRAVESLTPGRGMQEAPAY